MTDFGKLLITAILITALSLYLGLSIVSGIAGWILAFFIACLCWGIFAIGWLVWDGVKKWAGKK